MSGSAVDNRRLAAVVVADVAGYSRMMSADEEATVAFLHRNREELWFPKITEHAGRLIDIAGDGLLIEFASALNAMRFALDLQTSMLERNNGLGDDRKMMMRIGIHLCEVIFDETRIYGDGVNIAARLEQIAEPGSIFASDAAWNQVRGKLAVTADDRGEHRLKNIDQPVRVFSLAVHASGATPPRPALALPDKPSIAVLPFQNLSGESDQEYFADGMVEEVTTALSRFHWLFVIDRNSSFVYKGRAVDVKQVARELGVRYVLEGSVRKAGQKVRITGQLIDGTSGAHIWADRFDGTLEDIFDLQDQVTMSVVGAIEPKLRQAEIERARRKPTESLDAYDHLLRAYSLPVTREGTDQSLAHLKQALTLDPRYAAAAGYRAWCYVRRRLRGWTDAVEDEAREGCDLARLVAEGDRDDPLALAQAAYAMAILGRHYDISIALIDHALKLNPNSFQICSFDGWIRLYTDDPQQAVSSFRRAQRLNPLDPLVGTVMSGLSNAYWFMGDFEESLRCARLAIQANPTFPFGHAAIISALVSMDRMEEARAALRELLKVDPTHSLARWREFAPYRNPQTLEARLATFRKAGFPE